MKNESVVFYQDTGILFKHKFYHVKRKIGKPICYSFALDTGDLPCAVFNDITKKFESVVNKRGKAYAARKRQCYRKRIGTSKPIIA